MSADEGKAALQELVDAGVCRLVALDDDGAFVQMNRLTPDQVERIWDRVSTNARLHWENLMLKVVEASEAINQAIKRQEAARRN